MKCKHSLYISVIFLMAFLPLKAFANDVLQKSIPGYLVLREGTGSNPIQFKKNATYFNWENTDFANASDWPLEGAFLIERTSEKDSVLIEKNLFGDIKIGFGVELASKDTNFNNRIDSGDKAWKSLYLWEDKNGNAYIEKDELVALSSNEENTLSLDVEEANINGKYYSFYAFLPVYDKINTKYSKAYTLDIDTLFLPTLRGYGGLPDLHIVASKNPDIKSKLLEICITKPEDIFSQNYMKLREQTEQIMYMHGDVQNVDPNSRGGHIDARQLMILEKILGKTFSGYANKFDNQQSPNPNNVAAITLKAAWTKLLNKSTSSILAQCGAGKIFLPSLKYDLPKDQVELGIKYASPETLNNIKIFLKDKKPQDVEIFWLMMETFLFSLEEHPDRAPALLQALKNPAPETIKTQ